MHNTNFTVQSSQVLTLSRGQQSTHNKAVTTKICPTIFTQYLKLVLLWQQRIGVKTKYEYAKMKYYWSMTILVLQIVSSMVL